MKRWHEDYPRTKREWQKHRNSHVEFNKDWIGRTPGVDPDVVTCPCDNQIGRYRKRDAYDCGKPGCFVCHSDKFPKRSLTEQEVLSNFDYKEQLNEFRNDEGKRSQRR